MLEIGTSGSMSGEGKRGVAAWPKLPRLSSTLPDGAALRRQTARLARRNARRHCRGSRRSGVSRTAMRCRVGLLLFRMTPVGRLGGFC